MSLKVSETIHIQRPVKDVFAFAGAYENDALWRLESADGQRLFEPVEEGTRFTYEISVELGLRCRLMAPLLARRFRRQVAEDLRRLKRLLEEGNAWRDAE